MTRERASQRVQGRAQQKKQRAERKGVRRDAGIEYASFKSKREKLLGDDGRGKTRGEAGF
jgi:hypothetical protein